MSYQIIYADPPWSYKADNRKQGMRTAESFYPTMDLQDICKLPVGLITEPNAALFLWATAPCLPEAMQVMEAWGFTYKTIGFTWIKTNKDGSPFVGLGHYSRGNAELCLLGIRGSMPVTDRSVSQVVMTPRREHSRKPDEVYGLIERLYPEMSRIELFARNKRDGWHCWGNEVESDVDLENADAIIAQNLSRFFGVAG